MKQKYFFQIIEDACFATKTLAMLTRCVQDSHSIFEQQKRLTSLRNTTSLSSFSDSHEIISTTISSTLPISDKISTAISSSLLGSFSSGREIQNKSSGLISENDGDAGEDGKESSEMMERELLERSKIDANAFPSADIDFAFKGPTDVFESVSKLRGQRWSESEGVTSSFAGHVLLSDLSVKASISLQPVSNGIVKDLPETFTTSPAGNSTERERLRSILAEKLTLTEEAAILKGTLKKNEIKIEKAKVLCSNSNIF